MEEKSQNFYVDQNDGKTFISIHKQENHADGYCLMNKLYLHIKESLNDELVFYSIDEEEIIILVDNPISCSFKELKNILKSCPEGIGEIVTVNMFDLHKFEDCGWIKNMYFGLEPVLVRNDQITKKEESSGV